MTKRQIKMYKFYHPDKDQTLNKDDFVKYYNASYFTDSDDKISYETRCGKKNYVKKSSKYVENLIEHILEKNYDSFTSSDIALILAWKIGKIKHSASENKLKLNCNWCSQLGDYSSGEFLKWNGEPIKQYGDKRKIVLDVKNIADYLKSNGSELNDLIDKGDIQLAFDKLIKENWTGMGPVYLITLLYFITNRQHPGKCPIYDRFAMRALLAIKSNKKIGEFVECGKLPDKSNKNCSQIVSKRMKEYISLLNEIFGDDYKYDRNVDRALWVYGHLFKDSADGKVII